MGYVRRGGSEIAFDPDEQVQQVVRLQLFLVIRLERLRAHQQRSERRTESAVFLVSIVRE
jgi:hypothetical protein